MRDTIDLLLFDWARVIRDVSWGYASKALVPLVGEDDKQRLKQACFPALIERERGTLDAETFWSGVVRAYDLEPDAENRTHFIEAYRQVRGALIPETFALLRALRDSGRYRLAILSNGAPEICEVADSGEERAFFDAAIYSCEVGVRKPAARIYELALAHFDASPAQAAFIDDQPKNVEGARAAGIASTHFTGPDSLAEFRALIGFQS